jgi:hypothetical protein
MAALAATRRIQTCFRCSYFKLTLTDIIKEFRRPDDQIDQRAHEGEQCPCSGAGNQESVSDAALGIGVSPIDKRKPDDYDNDNKEVREDVHLVSLSPALPGLWGLEEAILVAHAAAAANLQATVQR